MRTNWAFLCVVLAGLLLATPAAADIIDNGDSLIDTDTDLEWLDLTQTEGLSWNQATTNFGGDGWVHATYLQVRTLFENAGFANTVNSQTTANDTAAALLLGAMGVTLGDTGLMLFEQGRGRALYSQTTTTTTTVRPFYREGTLGGAAAVISGFSTNLTATEADTGMYMVREYAGTPVPEPTTALLLGLGAIGLIRRRRR